MIPHEIIYWLRWHGWSNEQIVAYCRRVASQPEFYDRVAYAVAAEIVQQSLNQEQVVPR